MDANLRVFSGVVVICYFIILLYCLKKENIMLRYALMWLFAGIVFALIAIFPGLLGWVTGLLGIEKASNGLFALCFMFVIFILMALTMIVSHQKKRIRQLSQAIALLENDLRNIKKCTQENMIH